MGNNLSCEGVEACALKWAPGPSICQGRWDVGVGVGVEDDVDVGVFPPSVNLFPRPIGLGVGDPCCELSGQVSGSLSLSSECLIQ